LIHWPELELGLGLGLGLWVALSLGLKIGIGLILGLGLGLILGLDLGLSLGLGLGIKFVLNLTIINKGESMRRIVESEEGGLDSYLGQKITLFCTRYIYTGTLLGVNEMCVELKDPYIVYETGKFDDPKWEDAQKLPKDSWNVMLHSVESFGLMKEV